MKRSGCGLLWVVLSITLGLSACVDDNGDLTDAVNTGGKALFNPDPAAPVLPFPTDILFAGSTDGTLNIPPPADPTQQPLVDALNALDGFSTLAPISTPFDNPLDAASLVGGQSVRVFEVDTLPLSQGGAVTGIRTELRAGVDYLVGPSAAVSSTPSILDGAMLVITPLRPLKPKTGYMVALTDDIRLTNGGKAVADSAYTLLKQTTPFVDAQGNNLMKGLLDDASALALEPLRRLVNAQLMALAGAGVSSGSVILSWSFTTQSIDDVLVATRAQVPAAPPLTMGPVSIATSPGGAADIYCGTLVVPYYLTALSAGDPTAPLTRFWTGIGGSNLTRFNPMSVKTSDQTIPLLLSVPRGPKPAGGWPVAIYQHGQTRSRGDIVAVADSLAGAGFAVIAIDLPLHGQVPGEPAYAPALPVPGCTTGERTFDMDFVNNTTGAPGPDGIVDESGTHYINLRSLLTTRDNLRQTAVDLFTLVRALGALDYDSGGADLDTGQIRFVAHSTGFIAGAAFLALEPAVGAATVAMPGGGAAKLLDGSPTRGPILAAALGAAGILKGTQAYEDFLRVAQTALDSGDAINYSAAAVQGRGVLAMEVVGSESSLPDQTIPINVLTAQPPAVMPGTIPGVGGTDPVVDAMGLTQVSATTSGADLHAVVRYTAGHHSSFLSPLGPDLMQPDPVSAAVFREMQAQMATFTASNGALVQVGDASLIQ